jgi:hypothetical protein
MNAAELEAEVRGMMERIKSWRLVGLPADLAVLVPAFDVWWEMHADHFRAIFEKGLVLRCRQVAGQTAIGGHRRAELIAGSFFAAAFGHFAIKTGAADHERIESLARSGALSVRVAGEGIAQGIPW